MDDVNSGVSTFNKTLEDTSLSDQPKQAEGLSSVSEAMQPRVNVPDLAEIPTVSQEPVEKQIQSEPKMTDNFTPQPVSSEIPNKPFTSQKTNAVVITGIILMAISIVAAIISFVF